MTREGKTTTLHDIADQVGCSANTVSLALRDSRRISQRLRERIQVVAGQLNYTPNYAARNLRRRRSGLIGVFLAHALYDAVRTELVNRLLDSLHTAEYRPMLGACERHQVQPYASPWLDTFRQLQVEALVIIGDVDARLPDWTRTLPVILVGGPPLPSPACDTLALDRAAAGRMAAGHLISRGRRELIVAAGAESSFAAGCFAAIESAGGHGRLIDEPVPSRRIEHARTVGRSLERDRGQATGLVVGDAGQAAGLIRGLLDGGVRVPDDLAVVAYDYFPWAEVLAVPLTTVEQPITHMASAAVDVITRRLANPDAPPVSRILEHRLVVRQSS